MRNPGIANLHAGGKAYYICPQHRHWDFRGRTSIFPFDPTGRCMHFGHDGVGDHYWIVLAPKDSLRLGAPIDQPPKNPGPALMPTRTRMVMWAWLAVALQRIQYRDFAMDTDYPNISNETQFGFYTSIL